MTDRDGAAAGSAPTWLLTAGRLPATTADRMLPSLLAVIAADLDVSIVRIGFFIGLTQLAGLIAPLVGTFVRRSGESRVLLWALVGFSLASLGLMLAPGLAIFGPLLVVVGVTAMVYEATSTAWITRTAPFSMRSRSLGRFELAWSLGLLVGVPIAALLATMSWRLAYGCVALATAVVALRLRLRWDEANAAPVSSPSAPPVSVGAILRRSWRTYLGFGFIGAAAQVVVVVFGVWLTERFGFEVSAIGAVAFVFGVGELAAVTATMRFTDRLGSGRAAQVGSGLLVVAASALMLGSTQMAIGVVSLMMLLASHEFALVSAKPMLADTCPEQPAVGIGLGFGVGAATRAGAAVAGTVVFSEGGMDLAAGLSCVLGVIALLLFRSAATQGSTSLPAATQR